MAREVTDEMIGRLPLWAQELIRAQASRIAGLEDQNARLYGETHAGLAGAGESDTMLELPESGASRPLPGGAHIRFAGYYTARYGAQEITGGARALVIETDGDMVIRPTFDPRTIVIGRT